MKKKKNKRKKLNFVGDELFTENSDVNYFKRGAFIGGLIGGVTGLIINRRIILGILIGGLAGGYIGYELTKKSNRKPFTIN
jgi:uncharacterized protein YcfJ